VPNQENVYVAIAKHPILSFYFDVFRAVCLTPGMRLLIVGYSFRDSHVNEIIVDGIRSGGLKLFIIDPKSPAELRSGEASQIRRAFYRGVFE